jgi:hypothetical protein
LDRSLEEALERLDSVCDVMHRLAVQSAEDDWPAALQAAAKTLAAEIEAVAGAVDSAPAPEAAELVANTMEALSQGFAAFGSALAADITTHLRPKSSS